MADYKTPGVYIVEQNAFPNSAVAVETAIPVFIGYTETAEQKGKSLLKYPTRITSFTEYVAIFGGGFKAKFTVADATDAVADSATIIKINNKQFDVIINPDNTAFMYNAIRLFFANGGGICYILAVGCYANDDKLIINKADFLAATPNSIFEILLKEPEPTLIVIPDVIALGNDAYDVYRDVLIHCQKTQSTFGIFDLKLIDEKTQSIKDTLIKNFRNGIGDTSLNYGAAYFPWLNTTVVQADEVDFENLDAKLAITALLPEEPEGIKKAIENYKATRQNPDDKKQYHEALATLSPTYVALMAEIHRQLNILPPSGAIAGIYTLVDNSRGVWKAPANVSLSMVSSPIINISNEDQAGLNVDPLTGKSINVIRPFPDVGTLVWGGRTLDGNSEDWRYINVRRTLIMIEQSLKLAARAYVFEPNDANTWITVKSMFDNFLTNLWKQGALAGATPDQAFDVQIGLGATMTADDILDGKMLITVKVAIVRPAEFIVITFQQQMEQS